MSFMLDTTPDAERFYYDLLASKTSEERLIQANRLSVRMRAMVLDAIQMQNPGFSEHEVKMEYFRRILTREEFRQLNALDAQ